MFKQFNAPPKAVPIEAQTLLPQFPLKLSLNNCNLKFSRNILPSWRWSKTHVRFVKIQVAHREVFHDKGSSHATNTLQWDTCNLIILNPYLEWDYLLEYGLNPCFRILVRFILIPLAYFWYKVECIHNKNDSGNYSCSRFLTSSRMWMDSCLQDLFQ